MTTTKELLISARKLIEHPQNWIQGTNARDDSDIECHPLSSSAVCFCMLGALQRAAMQDYQGSFDNLLKSSKLLSQVSGGDNITHIVIFNDDATHAQVIEAFDRAIEFAE